MIIENTDYLNQPYFIESIEISNYELISKNTICSSYFWVYLILDKSSGKYNIYSVIRWLDMPEDIGYIMREHTPYNLDYIINDPFLTFMFSDYNFNHDNYGF